MHSRTGEEKTIPNPNYCAFHSIPENQHKTVRCGTSIQEFFLCPVKIIEFCNGVVMDWHMQLQIFTTNKLHLTFFAIAEKDYTGKKR